MKKILAIDDNKLNLKLIKSTLNYYIPDCRVLIAQSGEEGIKIAKEELPDTILLDIYMPEMDGFEVCRILKEVKITRHIPIILISAIVNDSKSIIKGLNIGADAFITKPIDPAELSAQVKVMLRIKQAEDNLKKESEKYRIMTETLPDAVTTINLKGEITYISPITIDIFGFDNHTEIIGRNAIRALVPEQRDTARKAMAVVLKEGMIKDVEFRFIKNDGTEFTGELSASLIKNDKGEPIEFIIITKNITDRKIAENEILAYQKKLKTLNSELTSAEEKERRKIAVNLHDVLGQTLSIAHIKLSSLSNIKLPPKVERIIGESSELIHAAITESRSLTYDLSPPILYELGLIPAIKWRLEQIEENFGIVTNFKSSENRLDINNDTRILLYRIICELLINIIKHANADLIGVKISKDQKYFYFSVIDNGQGFNYQPKTKLAKQGGFGLFSINERLDSIQGQLVIESEKEKGTKAMVIIPI
ncbi:MAG: response regulator [Bacteroidales bacterium]|jgi:PAS domain S-box-containing protein|nr:response regulator [Bacteroidales bacterium]